MDLETIKESYSMRDILDRLNISINRNGYCKCVFHKEDTASMKVYENSYYCFGCNKGGDIVDFVKDYYGLDFKEACKWISGEELTKRSDFQISAAKIRRQKKFEKEMQLKQELRTVNKAFDGLWDKYINAEPLSEEAAEAYNKWQILTYKQSSILEELGAT
jgi:DNA primase